MTEIRGDLAPGTWTPDAGATGSAARVWAQARYDVAATLRNGEQLLLTLVIPLVLLVALSLFDFGFSAGAGVDFAVPTVLALAVMSTAFTSLAIGTGFDRRSGSLTLLGTTPLTRVDFGVARTIAVLCVELVQAVLIVAVGLILGWRPAGAWWAVVLLVVLGTAAFAACGIAVAGLLRAEATLAVANAVFLLLMLGGGVVVPSSALPGAWGSVVTFLPSGALADGLRSVMLDGAGIPLGAVTVLLVWTALGVLVTARTFKWE